MVVPSLPDPRRRPVLTVLPYALLAALTAIAAISGRPADVALCALLAAWTLGMLTLRPAWRDRPRVMAVFVAGMIAIFAVLVVRAPWFGFFAPAAYVYAFRLLPWPAELLGVGAVAVVSGTSQAYGVDKTTAVGLLAYAAILAANVAPMCGFAWFNRRLEASRAENARLQDQLLVQAREAGVLDERQRMAREIHDTLAQGLTGIVTQLHAAEHAAEDPAAWRRHVAAATSLARESLSEARRSVHALRPEPLRTARLGDALAAVAGRWSALHGIPVQVTTTGTAQPLRPDAEAALLRAAQEALANVAKHARASRVGVTLSYLQDEVAVDVRDDGAGFDPAAPESGFGLVAMRQRIEGLAGTLQVESEPGGGTGISARVPS